MGNRVRGPVLGSPGMRATIPSVHRSEGRGVRSTATAVAAVLAAVVLVTVVLAGCGASRPTSTEIAAAQVAETLCGALRDWNNEMGDSLNATSQSITDDDDPDTANEVLAAGFDELVDIAEARRDGLDDLDLPYVRDRAALLAEIEAGADASIELLEQEQEQIAELEPITVERQAGALGGAFTALEGVLAVLEPEVGRYAEPLRDAFTAEDGCQHVVQPF